jgi:hypothetical protein
MEKKIVDGKVAVLYSPGYGSGWYTWSAPVEAVFDPELVDAVLAADVRKAIEIAERKYPDAYIGSNMNDMRVQWLPVGALFRIEEYDGAESIITLESEGWLTA